MRRIDNDSIEKITSKITDYLNDSYSIELQTAIQAYSNELQTLARWYQKARIGRDNVLSSIAQDIVSNLLSNLPQKFVQASINNIRIKTTDKQPGVKFDVDFQLDPIKPYVEFEISVNGGLVYSERVSFEVNSSCSFKDIEIKLEDSEKKICLGKLEGNLQIMISRIPFVRLDNPKEILNKNIDVDLSEFCV